MKLPGWGRRLKVAVSWALDLLLPAEMVQLKTEPEAALVQEHFEPGEVVFNEGDSGDRLYIILKGQAEVLVAERRVAALPAGAYFGEMALISGARRNATVRCVDAMDVLALPKRDFGLLATHLPGVRHSVEQVIEQRSAGPAQRASTLGSG